MGAEEHIVSVNRRNFLLGTAAAAANAGVAAAMPAAAVEQPGTAKPKKQPNVVIYHSDQFRWDFVGANGHNNSVRTPNLDALAEHGTNFNHLVTNQPVCAPSRSILLTGRYATETGVWRNGLGLSQDMPTIATEFRKAGYTANYIGKWHLQAAAPGDSGRGYVKPEHRGGFNGLFDASNALEASAHPYYGTIWDRDGNEITYKDQYRVDFITDRAEKFLRQKQEKPFLLVISQLEPHQQNDMGQPIAPKGFADRYLNATVPGDLRALPGTWQAQLPDYYGCIESIDSSVGRLRKILAEEKLAEDTIFVFVSDHGCHFMTRNQEYKRSTHNSSLRVPLLIDGPGFEHGRQISELVGMVDIAPTIMEAAGVPVPSGVKGRSFLPLLSSAEARQSWPNQQFIQISESMTGRAIRTKQWTYCVADPTGITTEAASANYHEYQMYDQGTDPYELVNLAGRKEYKETAATLRDQLRKMMVHAGEADPEIVQAKLYP
jgi:arylsulfatase A-like enzyme